MERLAPPSPPVGEPHPEETIDAPELRSFRLAAKQDELLPQREVLEREVSTGSERRTERAQQNEDQGHCLLVRTPLGHRPVFATGVNCRPDDPQLRSECRRSPRVAE